MGAVSGTVSGGIGEVAGEIAKFGERIVFQMFAHGISQSLLSGVSGGDMLQSFVSGALSSIVSSAWAGGDKAKDWKGLGGNFARKDIGILVFGTAAGAGGAALTKGNIWQGAAIGLVVSGLNHFAHSGDDNGYDTNGKQINNNGGDKIDYIYDNEGKVIDSTPVRSIGADLGGMTNLDGSNPKLTLRGFGIKSYMATGAINQDNIIFSSIVGGKVIGSGLNYLGNGLNTLKVPFARYAGAYIREFAPALNKGSGFRIGISKATIPGVKGTQMVFRATYGNNQNHFFNVIIGKWGK